MRFKINKNLIPILYILSLLSIIDQAKSDDKAKSVIKHDWKIVIYTGSKVWAGTDSEIFVELIGDPDNSHIIKIKPKKSQLEANSMDVFSLGDLGGKVITNLKSIIVVKQHSYSFFNDWHLDKIEVYDPNGKKYIFDCNCWLTTLKFKRSINLSYVVGGNEPESDETIDTSSFTARNTRVFPATIAILFILLVLIVFTYFGNEICKKWRENILYFSSSWQQKKFSEKF